MFTKHLTYLLNKLRFTIVVIARFIKILFRKKKEIEILYLNYETKHLFDTSYLIINYRFKNAIYYRFGNDISLEKQIKIFDLNNIDSEFDLVVNGFFDSKTYNLKFEQENTLDKTNFMTSISNLNVRLEQRVIPKLTHSKIRCRIITQKVSSTRIVINQPRIKISNTNFNQNDFL